MSLDDLKMGLLWVGEKFYPTPDHFLREGAAMGISKRINSIPYDFEVGKTWIALAHIKGIVQFVDNITGETLRNDKGKPDPKFTPAIFQLFKPSRIEYVIIGTETPEELEKMEKRGITLVNVVREYTQSELMDNQN